MKEEFKAGLFALIMTLCTLAVLFVLMLVSYEVTKDEPTKQPTVKCTDGKLYDVSYEGNITILEKRPFTTCEER